MILLSSPQPSPTGEGVRSPASHCIYDAKVVWIAMLAMPSTQAFLGAVCAEFANCINRERCGLIAVGQMAHTGWPYYGGILIAAGLSAYQQKLIFHREKALCFKTFLNNNWFGMAVFAGLAADYGLR